MEVQRIREMYDEYSRYSIIPNFDDLLNILGHQISKTQEAYVKLFLTRSNEILSEFDNFMNEEYGKESLSESDIYEIIKSYVEEKIKNYQQAEISEEDKDELIEFIRNNSLLRYDDYLPNIFRKNPYLLEEFLPFLFSRERKKSFSYLLGLYKKITDKPFYFLDYLEFLKRYQQLVEKAEKISSSSALLQYDLRETKENLQSRREFFLYEFNFSLFKSFRDFRKKTEGKKTIQDKDIFAMIDTEISNLMLEGLLSLSPGSDSSLWFSREILFLPPQPILLPYLILNIFRERRFMEMILNPQNNSTRRKFINYISEILEKEHEELHKLNISGLIEACNIIKNQHEYQDLRDHIFDSLGEMAIQICQDLISKNNQPNVRKFIIESLRAVNLPEGNIILLGLLDATSETQEIFQIFESFKIQIIYDFDRKILENIANIFKNDPTNTKKIIFRQVFLKEYRFFMGLIERQEELKDFIKELYDIEDDITYEKFLKTTLCFREFSSNCDYSWSEYVSAKILEFTHQYFDKISAVSNQDKGVIGMSVCLYLTFGQEIVQDRIPLLLEELPEIVDNLSILRILSTSLWSSLEKISREKWKKCFEFIKQLKETDFEQVESLFEQLEDKEFRLFILEYVALLDIPQGIEIFLRLISIVNNEEEWTYIVSYVKKARNQLGPKYYGEILLKLITIFDKDESKRNIFINIAKEYFSLLPLYAYDEEIIPLLRVVFNVENDILCQRFLEVIKVFKDFTEVHRISFYEIRNELVEKTLNFVRNYLDDLEEVISQNQHLSQEIIGISLYIYLRFGQNSLESFILLAREFPSFISHPSFLAKLCQLWPQIEKIPSDKRKDYIRICINLGESPSQEVQRILDSLIVDILESSDPEKAYQTIISVLEKNNLPLVAKIYIIFAALHPPNVLQSKIEKHKVLGAIRSYLRKRYIIYLDLLRIHIESANPSLREYIAILISGQELLNKLEKEGLDHLSEEEQKKLRYFFSRLEALYINSYLGRSARATVEIDDVDLVQAYKNLKRNLRVRQGQTVIERITEMYLKPLGIESLSEIHQRMMESKQRADKRNRELYQEAKNNSSNENVYLYIKPGDIMKGTNSQYLQSHIENGIVAKEFLGAYFPGSDATPLDTDAARPMKPGDKKMQMTVDEALKTYEVKAYGDIILVIRDRGQWEETSDMDNPKYNPDKYELFITGATSERHIGIRTGIASTEIDFIIATNQLISDEKRLENIFYEIARAGFYIPVVDEQGRVIFTPEMYEEYSRTFEGLERFYRQPLEVRKIDNEVVYIGKEQITVSGEKIKEFVRREIESSRIDRENLKRFDSLIRNSIREALEEIGTTLRDPESPEIRGADLLNTGSTGRMTNLAGDYDFDFILRVDKGYEEKLNEIGQKIKAKFDYQEDHSHSPRLDYYQVQLKGVGGMINADNQVETWEELLGEGAPTTIDIDIGISPKYVLVVFGSHDAVREKIESIANEEDRELVIGNILLAKRILKEGGAYERVKDGGFGGIGTENWILANNGNIIQACKSFLEAALDIDGNIIPFSEFKKRYRILNPGFNLRYMNHDNYIENMREEGYRKMVNVLINFLKENSI